MTLIAAFRCIEGVVICADSQESRGHYRVTVEKIAPQEVGDYQVVLGGAGDYGALIEGLIENLIEEIATWKDQPGVRTTKRSISQVLNDYYDTTVKSWPFGPDDTQIMDLILCVRSTATGKLFVWRLEGTAIKTVSKYALIGWNEELYEHEAQRLHEERAPALRCIMLGIHLLMLAETTSMYIRRPFQIIGVRDTSAWANMHPAIRQAEEGLTAMVWIEDPDRVLELTNRMATFDRMVADLLLACPDTTRTEHEFADRLARFKDEVMALRDQYKRASMFSEMRDWHLATTPEGMRTLRSSPYYKGVIPAYRDHPGGEVFKMKENDPMLEFFKTDKADASGEDDKDSGKDGESGSVTRS